MLTSAWRACVKFLCVLSIVFLGELAMHGLVSLALLAVRWGLMAGELQALFDFRLTIAVGELLTCAMLLKLATRPFGQKAWRLVWLDTPLACGRLWIFVAASALAALPVSWWWSAGLAGPSASLQAVRWSLVPGSLLILAAGAFSEEVMYRCMLLGGLLTRGLRPLTANVLQAAVFMCVHPGGLNPEEPLIWRLWYFGIGFLLGFLYQRTRSLTICTVVHLLLNVLIVQVSYEPMWFASGPTLVVPEAWHGICALLMGTIALIAARDLAGGRPERPPVTLAAAWWRAGRTIPTGTSDTPRV